MNFLIILSITGIKKIFRVVQEEKANKRIHPTPTITLKRQNKAK